MVSGFVTSPFDHSRIWSGLASEMRIALKLLTSSMVLLHAAAWLGDVMRNSDERGRAGRDATPRERWLGADGGDGDDGQSSNPARLIPPRSGRRYPEASSSASGISSSFWSRISALSPRLRSSLMRTLNDSGTRGGWISSPLTMASYVWTRPRTSSDFTVSSSWRMLAAPYASSAQTSISPNRWPPNCALPPSGCWVMRLYGPVDRAWILSSTRWWSLSM